MLTFDAQGRRDYVTALESRNAELLDAMFGANGIRAYNDGEVPLQGTRDAVALAEFTRQMTEYVDNVLETEDFGENTFRKVFSFNTGMGAGSDVFTKHEFNATGKSNWIDENGNNIPMLATGVAPTSRNLLPLGQGYRITRSELLRATRSRRPVSMEKAQAARQIVEEALDRVFWAGDTSVGVFGILNHTGIPINDATTGGWATATAAQIEADILKMVNNRAAATLNTGWQYRIGLPISQYQVLTQKRMSTSYSQTLASWLVQEIPQIEGFFATDRLNGAAADGDDYGILIPKGSRWGYGLLSQDATSIGPLQTSLLGQDFLIEARVGGFFTLKPLAFEIIEGI